MLDYFSSDAIAPFSLALALLLGLMLLELFAAFLGASLSGGGSDVPDVDPGFDADMLDVEGLDGIGDLSDYGVPQPQADFDVDPVVVGPKPLAWLGLGKTPVVIWLATLLFGFGVSGLTIQSVLASVFGSALPSLLAAAPAAFLGIWFARAFGSAFARVLPKVETSAIKKSRLSRRRGIVSQGTARRGSP
ncbi:MAG: hypothetical protein AAGK37_22310, partial [Pseudomonadota bacterium]